MDLVILLVKTRTAPAFLFEDRQAYLDLAGRDLRALKD